VLLNSTRNGISHALEPSHITDQQYTQQDAHENEDDDDEVVDKELEELQQKIQELQKEKERFANQLQAKRKASEKLEKLNQAKEEIERIQREIDEMKEKRTTHCGKIHRSRTLDQTEEPRKKISSRVMESHSSWILNNHYP
jgi:DNA repair ATPase RecN